MTLGDGCALQKLQGAVLERLELLRTLRRPAASAQSPQKTLRKRLDPPQLFWQGAVATVAPRFWVDKCRRLRLRGSSRVQVFKRKVLDVRPLSDLLSLALPSFCLPWKRRG